MLQPWENQGGRLLIVHGSVAVRDALSQRLQEAGHVAITAPGGVEGLALARAQAPELVILDVHAPGLEAGPFLEQLKAEKALRDLPVILLAPAGETEVVERCLAAGGEDFLLSPFSATLLKAQVRDYLQIGRWRRQESLRAERETLMKIERDVQIARNIQAGFLPSTLPQPEGYELAACFHPAREVAGDFYDAFTLSQGRRVGLVIADVCDKGVGAALFMALFRSLVRAYSQQHSAMRWMDVLDDKFVPSGGGRRSIPSTGTTALKNAVELTNQYMADNHADANMFATLFFGILDPATGQFMYVNGGHNPPVILGTVEGRTVIKARLKPTGPAVGMFGGVEYKIGQTTLEPGDLFYAFTDGVTDAKNPSGALFGEPRMLALLEQPANSAKAVVDRIDAALRDHIGEAAQFDDITMIAAQRRPTT